VQTISWETAARAAAPADARRPGRRTVVIATAGTVVMFLLGGVAAAALWDWFADPPFSVVAGDNANQDAQQLARQFGIDAAFAWACLAVAVPLGCAVGLLWHRVGWPLAITLCLAAAAASLLAWQLGAMLGPEDPQSLLAQAQEGDRLYQPLAVQAKGLLLTFPVGALAGFIAAVAASERLQAPRGERTTISQRSAKAVEGDRPGD